jgi:hypothetical protein
VEAQFKYTVYSFRHTCFIVAPVETLNLCFVRGENPPVVYVDLNASILLENKIARVLDFVV